MAQKKVRPASPCQAAASLGNLLSSPDRSTDNTFSHHLRQEPIDVVGLLAARSRVAPATIRAQFEAWRIGDAHG